MTSPPTTTPALVVHGLTKTYGQGETLVHAVDGLSFGVETGEFVVLLGPSGSGKTTTPNLLGAIEQPTSGRLEMGCHDISALDEAGRTAYRRDEVGFVFQLFNLVPSLTAMENVQLIAEITGPDAEQRSLAALNPLLTMIGVPLELVLGYLVAVGFMSSSSSGLFSFRPRHEHVDPAADVAGRARGRAALPAVRAARRTMARHRHRGRSTLALTVSCTAHDRARRLC